MRYIEGLDAYYGSGRSAVTLGKFDGLHCGHEKLIDKVMECAKTDGVESLVCSFDMRPLFDSMSIEKEVLMTKEERRFRLEHRVDWLVDCPFTKAFSQISAEDFIRDVLTGVFHAAYVVVGTDFCFGYGKKGDIHMLKEYEDVYDYRLIIVEKEQYCGREISSTYIREALFQGDIPLVNRLLGYPYTITGIVEHGRQLGRRLGFPTLNVAPQEYKMMPPNGVYAVKVEIDGKEFAGIGNVGVKPTVTNENRMLVESYLFDYHEDAYGKKVSVKLYEFRRPEQKFADVQEMKRCIDRDIEYGRRFFCL